MTSATDYKSKYAPMRDEAKLREDLVLAWLRLYIEDVVPVGNGTGTSAVIATWHDGPETRFDFRSPSRNLWFEATGTRWLRSESERRYGKAILGILKAKVDDAILYNMDDRLWFVGSWDKRGELRFIHCPRVRGYPLGKYARLENDYYLVPWGEWSEPCHVLKQFKKANGK